jgi:CHAD domain-containing protein/CYTH domain-containing protein
VPDAELLRLPVAEAAARLCRELLAEARSAESSLDDPQAKDALHDFRVALRRLRSALRSWREPLGRAVRKRERRALRDIQRATGEGRDAEVALEWLARQRGRCAPEHAAGVEWLEARCNERLAHTRARLDAELRSRFREVAERLARRLSRAPQSDGDELFAGALAAAVTQATDALAQRFARISGPGDVAEMHAARIACKRLRYLVEPVRERVEAAAAIVDSCKSLQTLLGEQNDAAALARELEAALAESAALRAARVTELLRAGYAERARREAWFTEWPGLIELAQILASERADRYARIAREWLEPGDEPLHERTRALASELQALCEGHAEIERKFLLWRLPPLEGRSRGSILIEQGWLPGDGARERIRTVTEGSATRYFRTLKLGSGIERTELEQEISAEVHAELWPRTEGCRLRKRRHRVSEGELTFEIDEFLDRELVLAEVELPSADTPVVLGDWLASAVAREVTGEAQYTGSALGR